jgi:hypothetical protein
VGISRGYHLKTGLINNLPRIFRVQNNPLKSPQITYSKQGLRGFLVFGIGGGRSRVFLRLELDVGTSPL